MIHQAQGPELATLLVTDSGLGGMSVFAGIAETVKKASPWRTISLVYFNAWPEQDRGYNHFADMDQRSAVFDNALDAMAVYRPDRIFIACNTLSVVYEHTRFKRSGAIPVTGIVDHGIQMIFEHLTKEPESSVIVLGTPTTAAARSHEKALVNLGISPERIVTQGCVNLAGRIERNPFGDDVRTLIDANVREAALRLSVPAKKIFGALCCTHFGYCSGLFLDALRDHACRDAVILNPNDRMVEEATVWSQGLELVEPDVTMTVVSRVLWEDERIDAYARLLGGTSPDTVEALRRYRWDSGLFDIE